MFADSEMAWTKSRDYYEEQVQKELETLENSQSEQTDNHINAEIEDETDV